MGKGISMPMLDKYRAKYHQPAIYRKDYFPDYKYPGGYKERMRQLDRELH